MSSLLAVVPARKASKGIPGKALRTVGGVPMVLRTLRAVEESGIAAEVHVSTDSREIASFCGLRGYRVIDRPAELAGDDVPLIDVARHAAEGWTGSVGIFQPTCPLVQPQTLRQIYDEWRASPHDWAITAIDDHHIYWHEGEPIGDRVNRQLRQALKRETGAAQFFAPGALDPGVEPARGTLWIPAGEALDVDESTDLVLAERLVTNAHIHFIVAMGPDVGTGHFHRSFALARALDHHRVSWQWRGAPPDWASEEIERCYWPFDGRADIVIFDRLAPLEEELLHARQSGSRVVVLEDETEVSRRYADLLVNALLDPADLRYADLRSEFLCLPGREHADAGEHVLVTFGGTDPAGLGKRCARVLPAVTGAGLHVVEPTADVHMAAELREADLCVTGQGRTVLEAAACETPCISVAANEREARHIRLPGVTYLGLHSTVTDDALRHAVATTLKSRALREEMAHAAHAAVDGRGLDRLVRRIEDLLL